MHTKTFCKIFLGIALFSYKLCNALDFYFDAPKNWKLSDPKTYSPTVRVCFVDPKEGYSPSINLAVEKTSLSLEEYVKLSQKPYQKNPLAKWRNLGSFASEVGQGVLIEIDLTSQAGKGRILQYIVKKNDEIAVLTAAASVEDLKNYLDLFKHCFQTLTATENLLDLIADESDKTALKNLLSSLSKESGTIQPAKLTPENKQTISQIEAILSKYHNKGECWHFLALRHCAMKIEEKSNP